MDEITANAIAFATFRNWENVVPIAQSGLDSDFPLEQIRVQPLNTYDSPSAFRRFFKTLKAFFDLQAGWDGYDAEIPSREAITHARIAITNLQTLNILPNDVCPSVEGGTGIYFIRENKYADLEFFNTGELLVGLSDRVNEPKVIELSVDDIDAAIQRIIEFLDD